MDFYTGEDELGLATSADDRGTAVIAIHGNLLPPGFVESERSVSRSRVLDTRRDALLSAHPPSRTTDRHETRE